MRVRFFVAAVFVVFGMLPSPGGLPSAAAAQDRPSDGGIYQWNNGRWLQVDGFGVRISVGPDGAPWVVNSRNEIYRWNRSGFDKMPGLARDIAVGGDGTVWIIGTDAGVYKWNGSNWSALSPLSNGRVSAIAVSDGKVYAGGNFTTAGNEDANNLAV